MSGADLDLSARTKPAIHLMAMYAFERTRTIVSPAHQEPSDGLTPRAGGPHMGRRRQIRGRYGRDPRHHGADRDGAYRQRLPETRAMNKTQAVARAVHQRLIRL